MSYPEPTKWCEKALGFYKEISEKEDYLDTAYGKVGFDIIKSDLEGYIDGLNSAIEKMNGEEKYEKYISIFSQDLENARFALSHLDENDYEKTRSCLSSVTSTRLIALPTKKYDFDEYEVETIKALRGENYELFNSHRKAFFSADEEKIKAASVDCHRILSAVFDMIFVIDERYTSEKNERGFIDFADAERYTYKLFVKENDEESGKLEITEIAEKYKKAFKEIYIDEYQDINPIQDTIFRAICRYDERGCETNRFMVGDIKQSIYRFRGARPDLFASYLDRFTRIGEGDGMTENKEFLAQNFRCSKGVVDFTNLVFSAIMKDSYGDGDRLVFSRREDFKVDSPSEIVLFSKDESDGKDYYTDEMNKALGYNKDIYSQDIINRLAWKGESVQVTQDQLLAMAAIRQEDYANMEDYFAAVAEATGLSVETVKALYHDGTLA
jgi:ATP-dependent helicase/nuclease subunit A